MGAQTVPIPAWPDNFADLGYERRSPYQAIDEGTDLSEWHVGKIFLENAQPNDLL